MPTQLTEPQSCLWRCWHMTAHGVKLVQILGGNWEFSDVWWWCEVVVKQGFNQIYLISGPNATNCVELVHRVRTSGPCCHQKEEETETHFYTLSQKTMDWKKAQDSLRFKCAGCQCVKNLSCVELTIPLRINKVLSFFKKADVKQKPVLKELICRMISSSSLMFYIHWSLFWAKLATQGPR